MLIVLEVVALLAADWDPVQNFFHSNLWWSWDVIIMLFSISIIKKGAVPVSVGVDEVNESAAVKTVLGMSTSGWGEIVGCNIMWCRFWYNVLSLLYLQCFDIVGMMKHRILMICKHLLTLLLPFFSGFFNDWNSCGLVSWLCNELMIHRVITTVPLFLPVHFNSCFSLSS